MKLHNFLDFCNNKSLNDINIFLKLGNNLESIVDNDGFNALQSACVLGYEDIIEMLIDHGFDINVLLTYDEIIHSYIFDKHKSPGEQRTNENIHDHIFNERKYHNSQLTLFDLCNTKISEKTKVEMCRKILIEKGLQLDMRYVDCVINKITNINVAISNINDNINKANHNINNSISISQIRPGSAPFYINVPKIQDSDPEKQREIKALSIVKENNVILLQSNNNKMIFYTVEKNDICCIEKIRNLCLIHDKIVDGDGNNLLHNAFKVLNNHLDKNSEKHGHVQMINLLMTRIKLSLTNNFNETSFDMISDENYFKFIEFLTNNKIEEKKKNKVTAWERTSHYNNKNYQTTYQMTYQTTYQLMLELFQSWKQSKKDKEKRDHRLFVESNISELRDRVKSLELMLDTEKNIDKFENDRMLRKINKPDH